jgi:hypothetical protein
MKEKTDLMRVNLAACESLLALYVLSLDLNLS